MERKPSEQLPYIELAFAGLFDIRCPVHWTLGEFEIRRDPDSVYSNFAVPSAGVSITASDMGIVVQNEHPKWHWELLGA